MVDLSDGILSGEMLREVLPLLCYTCRGMHIVEEYGFGPFWSEIDNGLVTLILDSGYFWHEIRAANKGHNLYSLLWLLACFTGPCCYGELGCC